MALPAKILLVAIKAKLLPFLFYNIFMHIGEISRVRHI
jgi:hypothetical protein